MEGKRSLALGRAGGALRAKAAKLASSGRRLPSRLARAGWIVLDLLGAALRGELRAGLGRRQDARLVRRSDLFDPEFYLLQCAGDRGARRDPVRHYFRKGAALGLDPSPLFDTSEYLLRHGADLAPGENPLAHHLRYTAGLSAPPDAAPGSGAGAALLRALPFRAPPGDAATCSVLVVDGTRPPEAGGRSGRVVALVEALRAQGHPVILFAAGSSPVQESGSRAPFPAHHNLAAAGGHLEAEGHHCGLVLLAGPDETARLLPAVRAHAPGAFVVYDAAGVHGARLERDAAVARGRSSAAEADRLRRVEKVNAACSDLVLVLTAHDRDALLAEVPGARVEVLPHEPAAPSGTGERLQALLARCGRAGVAPATKETAA